MNKKCLTKVAYSYKVMMKKNGYIWSLTGIFMLVLTVIGLTACGPAKKSSSTVVLVTSADNPPFEFYQFSGTQRQIIGFDIALAHEITGALGLSLEIKEVQFSGIIPTLQSKRADFAMASLSVTDERKKVIDFSTPYFETTVAVITLPGISLKDASDLQGKTIGVQLGTSYEQALQESAKKYAGIKIHSLNNVGELVQELRAKRIDGVLTEEMVARAYVGSNRDIDMSLIKGFGSSFSIAFPKGSLWTEKFNQALKKLKEDGTLDQLRKDWFKS